MISAKGRAKLQKKSRRGERRRGKKDKINKMHMSNETTIKTILLVFGTRPEAIKIAYHQTLRGRWMRLSP